MPRIANPAGQETHGNLIPQMLEVGAHLVDLPYPVIRSPGGNLEAFDRMAAEAAIGPNQLLAQVEPVGALNFPLVIVALGAARAGKAGREHRMLLVMLKMPVILILPLFPLLFTSRSVRGYGELSRMTISVMAGGAAGLLVGVRTGRREKQVKTGVAGINRTPLFILVPNEAGIRIVDVDVAGLTSMHAVDVHEVERLLEPGSHHLIDLVARSHEIKKWSVTNRVPHGRVDQLVLLEGSVDHEQAILQARPQGGIIGGSTGSGYGRLLLQHRVVGNLRLIRRKPSLLQLEELVVENLDGVFIERYGKLPDLRDS